MTGTLIARRPFAMFSLPRMDRRLLLISAALFLSVWVALAVCQWASFHHANPLGTDLFIYLAAVHKAWQGGDPYLPRAIGWGYLYPPPSLLMLKAVETISPVAWGVTYTFVGVSLLAGGCGLWLLAGGFTWQSVYLSVVLLASAGMVETIYIGQVNALVVFLIAAFLWAFRRESYLLACAALAVAICLKTTPVVFATLFLTRAHLKWLLPLTACVVALWLTTERAIPSAGLTSSFFASLRWAAQQPVISGLNYSLSSTIAALFERRIGLRLAWGVLQQIKLIGLALLVGASYLSYVSAPNPAATRVLVLTATVAMVLAPNIVWLHHAALLIPAFWILIMETRERLLAAGALAALVCIQCARCARFHLGIPEVLPLTIAQGLLLASCVVYTAQVRLARTHA